MSRILVIDDQISVRSLIREMLEAAGHSVIDAANGRGVVKALATPIDLVVTDVMMPEMDGFEVVRHVKSVKADIPVLVISGEPRNRLIDVLSLAKKLGADRVLSKGDIRTSLAATVAEMLGPAPDKASRQA